MIPKSDANVCNLCKFSNFIVIFKISPRANLSQRIGMLNAQAAKNLNIEDCF